MTTPLSDAIDIRQKLAAMDAQHPDCGIYIRKFLGQNESATIEGEKKVYTYKEIPHVGVGFNMGTDGSNRRNAAIAEWDAAFANSKNKPDFNEVLTGKTEMTPEQITTLFNATFNNRVGDVQNMYGAQAWNNLKPNERLAIVDMYYNAQTLVDPPTNFFKHMRSYALSTDEAKKKQYLEGALWEVKYNSLGHNSGNPQPELQGRRDVEAEMLNTYGFDLSTIKKQPTPTPGEYGMKTAPPGRSYKPASKPSASVGPMHDIVAGMGGMIADLKSLIGGMTHVDQPQAPSSYAAARDRDNDPQVG